MKSTTLAVAFAIALALPLAAFAQTATPATPAKPVQAQATPAKPATPAPVQAKIDCTKKENAAKDECKATVKKP